jgi:hypothetical protein
MAPDRELGIIRHQVLNLISAVIRIRLQAVVGVVGLVIDATSETECGHGQQLDLDWVGPGYRSVEAAGNPGP